jgi:hypothetical protein
VILYSLTSSAMFWPLFCLLLDSLVSTHLKLSSIALCLYNTLLQNHKYEGFNVHHIENFWKVWPGVTLPMIWNIRWTAYETCGMWTTKQITWVVFNSVQQWNNTYKYLGLHIALRLIWVCHYWFKKSRSNYGLESQYDSGRLSHKLNKS